MTDSLYDTVYNTCTTICNSNSEEYHTCVFCDKPYPTKYIIKKDDMYICNVGSICNYILHKLDTIEKDVNCFICTRTSTTIELPSCNHRLCIHCTKTIFIGSNEKTPPLIYYTNMINKFPKFPLLNDIDFSEKIKIYSIYEHIFLHYDSNSYEELIFIRNSTKNIRPVWMNSIEFLEYEDKNFLSEIERNKIEKIWIKYDSEKLKGNKKCPFCNVMPNIRCLI